MKCELCGMELYGDFDVCPSCGYRLDYTRDKSETEEMPTYVLQDYPPEDNEQDEPGPGYSIDSLTPIEDPGDDRD